MLPSPTIMERISLSNLQEQFDTLKSTSLPQLKKYFRRRISKCLNECKLHATNMNKLGKLSSKNNQDDNAQDENEYELGWGSDFSDYDEEDEEEEQNVVVLRNKSQTSLPHSRSLQIINSSDMKSATRRDLSPPPLPKHLPPNLFDENESRKSNPYVMMSPDNATENDYLLPNSRIDDKNVESGNYECINTPDTQSLASSSSTYEKEASLERPLPPIPRNESCRKENRSLTHEEEVQRQSWFKDVERNEAECILRKCNLDGAYLVRKSRRAGIYNPYTLSIFLNHAIFHLNIRICDDHTYALGKEKSNEKYFSSVVKLIEHHQCEPIFLTSKGMAAGKVCLSYCASD